MADTQRAQQINAELARHGVNQPATDHELERTAGIYWACTAAAFILADRVRTATHPA